ncbi:MULTISPECIES: Rid family detoxifying hydrolase [Inquilinus]|jgi:2-iminobutanoate/2-iminopropanoate deaminase|uniref:2-iminobutanoate/2-iminopropanoate deaminase n=1 Tax=Inquilinus ginsengisoli TaxID=363840 RepID=A0ABU1JPN1_9PROT|nr:Rid family detoxifying hydrolase [Inquilinus ginsengisoli]MDR6290574.1 2-iminobutanoate/2-iminopropanoate deaminase [Inquilinus ginsengisoli]
MARKTVTSAQARAIGPYSHGVVGRSDLLFLSGQTPIDPITGLLVEGDAAAQTEQCLANLSHVLDAADLTFDAVVKVNVFLTDMDDFAAMNAVYERHFRAPYPARSTIGVAALPLGARVEIEMIAAMPRE